jgi:hypothetical protein
MPVPVNSGNGHVTAGKKLTDNHLPGDRAGLAASSERPDILAGFPMDLAGSLTGDAGNEIPSVGTADILQALSLYLQFSG